MQNRLTVCAVTPTYMTHDSEIDDAEDGYLGVRDRLENAPHLAICTIDGCLLGYHCAPG